MKKLLFVPAALLFLSAVSWADEAPPPPPTDFVAKCKSCHGPDLGGKGKTPAIAGDSVEELKASLTTKIPKQMNAIASKMSPADIDSVVDIISKLPKPAPK